MPVVRQIDPKVKKLREKADLFLSERKWEKALQLYLESEEAGEFDPRIGQRIADLYKRLGEKSEAIEHYKRVVKHYSLAGFWAKAIAVSKMILEIDPGDLKVRNQLAELYSAQGKTREDTDVRRAEERAALSISGMEPRTMEVPPEPEDYGVFGQMISLRGEEPRTMEERPREGLLELTPDSMVNVGRAPLGMPLAAANKVPLFSDMEPDELGAVLERLAVRRFPAESYICEEGDIGDAMYIISEGCVEVSVRQPDGSRIPLTRLSGGDFFGEYSLLMHTTRNATVQAKTDVEVLEITSRDFDTISAKHPRIWNILEEYLRHRVLDTIFSRSPVFRVLSPEERKSLIGRMTEKKVPMDTVIMAERTDGDEMYFVKSGTLLVTSHQGRDRIVVGELGPGDYFGEVAMLTGKPRTATVQSKTECELFCLTRKSAAPVLRNNREILELLRSKMEERAQETIQALESYKELRNTLTLV
jgi:cAMP-dependent protein kinase regulator